MDGELLDFGDLGRDKEYSTKATVVNVSPE